jgi:hypothetical protein
MKFRAPEDERRALFTSDIGAQPGSFEVTRHRLHVSMTANVNCARQGLSAATEGEYSGRRYGK